MSNTQYCTDEARSITDQIPCGVMLLEKTSGHVEFCNPVLSEWLQIERGQNFESQVDKKLRNIVLSSEACDKLLLGYKKCMGRSVSEPCVKITLTTLSGRILHFVPQDEHDSSFCCCIVHDITAIVAETKQKQELVLREMKCISHDMRCPMQAITLAAQFLKETLKENDGTEAESYVETIISSALLLETIMSNVLEFKTNTQKLIPSLKPVDVASNLDRIINMLRHSTLINEGTTLSSNCDVTKTVLLDGRLFDRIVLNLVTNALKFTTKGHVTVNCSLQEVEQTNQVPREVSEDLDSNSNSCTSQSMAGAEDNQMIKISNHDAILKVQFIDTGCGMTEEAQAHIGEIDFFTGNAGGFGLGTTIVCTYVKALDGKLTVESEVGIGTTVTVEIPIQYAPDEQQIHSTSKGGTGSMDHILLESSFIEASMPNVEQSQLEASVLKEGAVLVVDDVVINRKLIVKALEKGGFEVDQAENGAIGLKMMLEKEYRTVFMDMNMPVMNGYEAVQEYWKARPSHKDSNCPPKIIMLTGRSAEADRDLALACGAHDFLTKPVTPKQLWEAAQWTPLNS